MRKRHPFTLLEIMVVVAIIGLISALALKDIIGTSDAAKRKLAKASIDQISDALNLYKVQTGRYPSTDEGLAKLSEGGENSVLKDIPMDPWNREFIYEYPSRRDKRFDIYSLGEDGLEGGEGINEDISN